jgi:parallel beta-helix repeat protein
MLRRSVSTAAITALLRPDSRVLATEELQTPSPGNVSADFFVATNGNDSWSGTLPEPNSAKTDGPVASLFRAQALARERKATGPAAKPITVMVRSGKYFLESTLIFGPEDSGNAGAVITFIAYPGESPILSGGLVVQGWTPHQGKILKAKVPGTEGGMWKFRQIFLHGEPQVRSRWPKYDVSNPLYGGWAYMEGPAAHAEGESPAHGVTAWRKTEGSKSASTFRYRPGTFLRRWAKPTQAEVNLLPGVGSGWYNDIIPIKSINEQERVITLTREFLQLDRAPWYIWESLRPDNRFILENLLEELTQPGEWCLDFEDGILYFWPPDGNLGSAQVVVPRLHCLVEIKGASYIKFSGFTFTETNGGDDTHRDGLDGYGAMFPHQGWQYCGEAVHLEGAEHCALAHNRFYAVGGNAIYLSSYNLHNVIRENEISHVGANGICLVGTIERSPMSNQIEDNHIHHCGVINQYIAGVFLGLSEMNVVGHNSIHHMPHHGINLGSRGYGRNIIEYNEIRHTCLQLFDTGAINSWMEDPGPDMQKHTERSGHIIRHNLIADTGPSLEEFLKNPRSAPDRRTGIRGIYLDTNTTNDVIYSNLIVRSGGWGFHLQNGKNNVIENNIIVDCSNAIIYADWVSWFAPQMDGNMTGNRFCRNIFYSALPPNADQLKGGPNAGSTVLQLYRFRDKTIEDSDYNVYFIRPGSGGTYNVGFHPSNVDSPYITALPKDPKSGLKIIPFEKWQQMGFEEHSLRVDPLFVDAERDDYRLKPESPALKLGFEPIDFGRVGIRKNSSDD